MEKRQIVEFSLELVRFTSFAGFFFLLNFVLSLILTE